MQLITRKKIAMLQQVKALYDKNSPALIKHRIK